CLPRHPIQRSCRMTPARPIATVGAAFLFSFSGLLPLVAQEPAASAAPRASPTPPASAAPSTPVKKKKHSHADDFLIRGTVFTPVGLSFPGAELRIRRASERSEERRVGKECRSRWSAN